MNIKDDLIKSFKEGNSITQLIYVNLAVFLLLVLIQLSCKLFLVNDLELIRYIGLPSDPQTLLYRPWTILSYMFVHQEFVHILFNLINLYWCGRLFLLYFNQKQAVGLYLLGGIAGGLLYLLSYNIFPYFQTMGFDNVLIGASASVLAIMMGIAAYAPDMELQLVLLGRIKLKYIAAVFFFLSLFSVAGENAGGSIAHIGGIAIGYLFAVRMKKGKDLTAWINQIIDFFVDLFARKPKMKVVRNKHPMTDQEWNEMKKEEMKRLDDILDKIKKNGYDSLTATEKKQLFDQSNKS